MKISTLMIPRYTLLLVIHFIVCHTLYCWSYILLLPIHFAYDRGIIHSLLFFYLLLLNAFTFHRLFRGVGKPKPADNPLLILFIVGGVNCTEVKQIRDLVNQSKSNLQVMYGSWDWTHRHSNIHYLFLDVWYCKNDFWEVFIFGFPRTDGTRS